jgi:hypothetical protein
MASAKKEGKKAHKEGLSSKAGPEPGSGGGPCVGPWSKPDATERIRRYARDRALDLHFKRHALERLDERGITTSDVLHVLKMGFVLQEPEQSTNPSLYRYRMESRSPNSNGRTVGVVVIPNPSRPSIKVVTVMWIDES